jgi:hypothetical protein
VNAITPRDRTRMTTGYSSADADGFDNRAPENISPVVAWLAGPDAGHISAKVFAGYAGQVDLQTPIECEVSLSVGERSWTVAELPQRSGEFFTGGRLPGVAPMQTGIGGN